MQFARGRACVRSFVQGGCGWCVNRDLSVTREIWTAWLLGEREGETRLLIEQCIIVVVIIVII